MKQTVAPLNGSLLALCQTGGGFVVSRKQKSATKTSSAEEEEDFWAKAGILYFPGIKIFWAWWYWEQRSAAFPWISARCLLGWVPSLETKWAGIWATWEKLRTGNCEAWTHKKIGRVSEMGFQQRIYVHGKPLMPIWLDMYHPKRFGPILSHSHVRLTKCIDSTFTLSLKKKWKKRSYIKARFKASFLLCRQTWVTMCSLFDIEEGWLE